MSLFSWSATAGLQTKAPSTRPIRTPAIGPLKGMFEISRAADAASIAATSESFSSSTERTDATIWVSWKYFFGNRGLMERSMIREVRISFSLGRPSLLKKPPGIFPAAKVIS